MKYAHNQMYITPTMDGIRAEKSGCRYLFLPIITLGIYQ